MATVQINDEKKYTRAIGLLHETGRMFRTKPTRQLVVDPIQLQVLHDAGLITKVNGARKLGQKKTTSA